MELRIRDVDLVRVVAKARDAAEAHGIPRDAVSGKGSGVGFQLRVRQSAIRGMDRARRADFEKAVRSAYPAVTLTAEERHASAPRLAYDNDEPGRPTDYVLAGSGLREMPDHPLGPFVALSTWTAGRDGRLLPLLPQLVDDPAWQVGEWPHRPGVLKPFEEGPEPSFHAVETEIERLCLDHISRDPSVRGRALSWLLALRLAHGYDGLAEIDPDEEGCVEAHERAVAWMAASCLSVAGRLSALDLAWDFGMVSTLRDIHAAGLGLAAAVEQYGAPSVQAAIRNGHDIKGRLDWPRAEHKP